LLLEYAVLSLHFLFADRQIPEGCPQAWQGNTAFLIPSWSYSDNAKASSFPFGFDFITTLLQLLIPNAVTVTLSCQHGESYMLHAS